MNLLELLVIRNGRPTWLLTRVLNSNKAGRAVFRFFLRIELQRRNKELERTKQQFKEQANEQVRLVRWTRKE